MSQQVKEVILQFEYILEKFYLWFLLYSTYYEDRYLCVSTLVKQSTKLHEFNSGIMLGLQYIPTRSIGPRPIKKMNINSQKTHILIGHVYDLVPLR